MYFIHSVALFHSNGRIASCLLSNTCMGLAIDVLSRLEIRREGLTWDNVAEPLSQDDDFTMAWAFGMLLIDAVWYYVLAW